MYNMRELEMRPRGAAAKVLWEDARHSMGRCDGSKVSEIEED